MDKFISELEDEESPYSPYCKVCKCCAELPCCNVNKFLLGHTKDCKHHKIYKKEILDSIEKVIKAENILCELCSDKDKLTKLSKVFEVTDE